MRYDLRLLGRLWPVFFLLAGCRNDRRSPIEVIKLDPRLVAGIRAEYDSVRTEWPRRHDFYKIDYYYRRPSEVDQILSDSLGHIVGIGRTRGGRKYLGAEYYPNGQIMGKVSEDTGGRVVGAVTYYYADGRVRLTGTWRSYTQVGVWREYDSSGWLTSVKYYSDNGKLEREEKVRW